MPASIRYQDNTHEQPAEIQVPAFFADAFEVFAELCQSILG
jgi:hypothetical protein